MFNKRTNGSAKHLQCTQYQAVRHLQKKNQRVLSKRIIKRLKMTRLYLLRVLQEKSGLFLLNKIPNFAVQSFDDKERSDRL